MAGKVKRPELLPEFIRLRGEGKSLNQIRDITGVPTETVRLMLRRTGNFFPLASGHRSPVDYSHLDPLWWAEFRGFFFGEGSVMFRNQKTLTSFGNPTSRRKLVPLLQISVRRDDHLVLEDVHQKLGGQFHHKKAHGATNEAVTWLTPGWSRTYNIVVPLSEGLLPSKKRAEMLLMKEACELRFTFSYDLTDEEHAQLYEYDVRLRELKLLRS